MHAARMFILPQLLLLLRTRANGATEAWLSPLCRSLYLACVDIILPFCASLHLLQQILLVLSRQHLSIGDTGTLLQDIVDMARIGIHAIFFVVISR